MKYFNKNIAFLFVIITTSSPAYAYLDPGTGSMLVSALVGIVATLFFMLKGIWYRGVSILYGLVGRKYQRNASSIIFYSEGPQYWQTFRPILENLSKMGEKCTYLTSSEKDPGLDFKAEGVITRCIGMGNKAFAVLNTLEADVCVMTTPGLDVLQIRRSKGVKHYAHIVHAPGDVSLYRLYGLDYYDSLLSSGPHQEESIRELERQRGTKAKEIIQAGCAYYDYLVEKRKQLPQSRHNEIHILLAPTWGEQGLLSRFGAKPIHELAKTGAMVTVRPHPQSQTVERVLLDKLQAETACYSNVQWDDSPDNFVALAKADLLISDWSGIVYDFAFVMERPVLTMAYTPDLRIYDTFDLPYEAWDFASTSVIGRKLAIDEIPKIGEIATEIMDNPQFLENLRQFRAQSVYNFGCAGPVLAKKIVDIRNTVQSRSSEALK